MTRGSEAKPVRYARSGISRSSERYIESLELTIEAHSNLIQEMKTLSKKRNATSYDSAGIVQAGTGISTQDGRRAASRCCCMAGEKRGLAAVCRS